MCVKRWLCFSTKYWHGWIYAYRSVEHLKKKRDVFMKEKMKEVLWNSLMGLFFFCSSSMYVFTHVCLHTSCLASGLTHLSNPKPPYIASTFPTCSFLSLYPACPSSTHLKHSCSFFTTKLPKHLLQEAFLEFPASVLLLLKPVLVLLVVFTIYQFFLWNYVH